ncbi:MAG: hypothetical protein H0W96_01740 [Solirubrobacterales bacterium]|nr:hypothetical protein [Solirubrobacterales bacterium]
MATSIGLLVIVAGAGLLYYVSDAVELETEGNRIEQLIADAVISSSTGPGVPLLLASGLAIAIGAALAR